MASFVGTSAGYYGRSLHGHIQIIGGSNLDLSRDVYRYQILYMNVVRILESYITFFTTGDYTNLKDKLTIKAQNALTEIIQNSDYYYNVNIDNLVDFNYEATMFETFRNNTYYVLNGLIQAVSQYDELEALRNKEKECDAILSSEQSILEYLNSGKQASLVAFSAEQKYNINVVLKPWYERYIIKYGAPNDGVFLTERMAVVVRELISEGKITMEQFTSNRYP
jgi:hypothetical protein